MQLVILVEQVEGNLLKSGRFRPNHYIIATPLFLRFGLVHIFRAPNLLESKFDCPGFSRAGNKTLLSPLLLMLPKHHCWIRRDVFCTVRRWRSRSRCLWRHVHRKQWTINETVPLHTPTISTLQGLRAITAPKKSAASECQR